MIGLWIVVSIQLAKVVQQIEGNVRRLRHIEISKRDLVFCFAKWKRW